MPSWGEILNELNESDTGQGPDFDGVRRKNLSDLNRLPKRPVIIYYSAWLQNPDPQTAITLADIQGFMETVRGLEYDRGIDLILHLPGGEAETACRIVEYLRAKFTGEIRAFVPIASMSAGTMLALGCDTIVMGEHSQLGPTDPQIPQQSGGIIRYVPTQAILQQFAKAQDEINENISALAVWTPILGQYGTSLLAECEAHQQLAESLVERWLSTWMLKDDQEKAKKAAEWFNDFNTHLSHSQGINREQAGDQGIVVERLEDDNELQDAVLSIHHTTMHTLGSTNAIKIIENHKGKAFILHQTPVMSPIPVSPDPPPSN